MVEGSTEKKKSSLIYIIIAVVALLLIGLCLWLFVFNKTDNPGGNNSEGGNDKGTESVFDSSTFNGVYTYGFSSLKLFAVTKDTVRYSITGSDRLTNGEFVYSNGVLKFEFMDLLVTIKKEGDNIVVDSNSSSFISGTYTKTSSYTADNYFQDNYGSDEFFNTKYNGKYVNGKETIYVYQSGQKSISVLGILDNNIDFKEELEINDDGVCVGSSSVQEYYLTLNDNKINFVIKSSGVSIYEKDFTRERTITKSNVIEVYY